MSLIRSDDHTATFAGLAAGQIDAVAGSLQDIVLFAEPDEDLLQCVLVKEDSRGVDCIVTTTDILRDRKSEFRALVQIVPGFKTACLVTRKDQGDVRVRDN